MDSKKETKSQDTYDHINQVEGLTVKLEEITGSICSPPPWFTAEEVTQYINEKINLMTGGPEWDTTLTAEDVLREEYYIHRELSARISGIEKTIASLKSRMERLAAAKEAVRSNMVYAMKRAERTEFTLIDGEINLRPGKESIEVDEAKLPPNFFNWVRKAFGKRELKAALKYGPIEGVTVVKGEPVLEVQ